MPQGNLFHIQNAPAVEWDAVNPGLIPRDGGGDTFLVAGSPLASEGAWKALMVVGHLWAWVKIIGQNHDCPSVTLSSWERWTDQKTFTFAFKEHMDLGSFLCSGWRSHNDVTQLDPHGGIYQPMFEIPQIYSYRNLEVFQFKVTRSRFKITHWADYDKIYQVVFSAVL